MSPNDRRASRPFGPCRNIKRNFHSSSANRPCILQPRCVHPSLSPFSTISCSSPIKTEGGRRIRSRRKTVVTVGHRFKDDGNSDYRFIDVDAAK